MVMALKGEWSRAIGNVLIAELRSPSFHLSHATAALYIAENAIATIALHEEILDNKISY